MGREVHGRIIRELPISYYIIDRVNKLGSQQKQMNMRGLGLVFEWHLGHHVNDDNPWPTANDDDVNDTLGEDEVLIPNPHPVLTVNDVHLPRLT